MSLLIYFYEFLQTYKDDKQFRFMTGWYKGSWSYDDKNMCFVVICDEKKKENRARDENFIIQDFLEILLKKY